MRASHARNLQNLPQYVTIGSCPRNTGPEAKGRWVETQMREQFPNLPWSRTGADLTVNGIHYEILLGSKSNMDRHAMRMSDIIFRMITFQ